MLDDRFDAILPTRTAAHAQPQLARRQVEIVVDHDDLRRFDLIETGELPHGFAAQVHKSERFRQQHFLLLQGLNGVQVARQWQLAIFAYKTLRDHRPVLHFASVKGMTAGQQFNTLKADVVTVLRIFWTGVAQPDDHFEFGHKKLRIANCV